MQPPPPQGGFEGGYYAPQQSGFPPVGQYTPPYGGYSHGGQQLPYGPPGQLVPQQPQEAWVVRPTISSCPPGLEYLTQINQLLVKQKKELFETFTNIETANKYVCLNTMNQVVYKCSEESNFFARQCLKSQRPFVMHLEDGTGTEVIRVIRPYKYTCCFQCCSCVSCCQDVVEVECPVGVTVGYVQQLCKGCDIRYEIQDVNKAAVLQIHGPSYCHCQCFGADINFKVMTADGTQEIGKISKQWSNILQEYFTDADNFGVSFPMDLDVRFKAILLGAVFLIDFMFFEDNQPRKDN